MPEVLGREINPLVSFWGEKVSPYAFDYVVYGLAFGMVWFGLIGLLFSSGATTTIVRTAAKL